MIVPKNYTEDFWVNLDKYVNKKYIIDQLILWKENI